MSNVKLIDLFHTNQSSNTIDTVLPNVSNEHRLVDRLLKKKFNEWKQIEKLDQNFEINFEFQKTSIQFSFFFYFCMKFRTVVSTLKWWHDDLTVEDELFKIDFWPLTMHQHFSHTFWSFPDEVFCNGKNFYVHFFLVSLLLVNWTESNTCIHAKLRQLLTKYGTWILNALCQGSNPYIERLW